MSHSLCHASPFRPQFLDIPTLGKSGDDINFAEGCLVTKVIDCSFQPTSWINTDGSGDPTELNKVIEQLSIIPYQGFDVKNDCNLAFLDPRLRIMLDPYEFIAVTASAKTLDQLVKMVKSDNNRWKQEVLSGCEGCRKLDFSCPAFMIPEYELVVLRPEHLLLPGSSISLVDNEAKSKTDYVIATDHRLRKSHDPQSLSFPAFRHPERGDSCKNLNVFLVVLNADIGFRHYFEMIKTEPPAASLPDDVLNLMHRTSELVDLLYWKPTASLQQELTDSTADR